MVMAFDSWFWLWLWRLWCGYGGYGLGSGWIRLGLGVIGYRPYYYGYGGYPYLYYGGLTAVDKEHYKEGTIIIDFDRYSYQKRL